MAYEATRQATPAATGKDLAGDLERRKVGARKDRCAEGEVEARIWNLILHRFANLTAEWCAQCKVRMLWEFAVCGDATKVSFDGSGDLRLINVANNGEHRIIRRVPGGEEVAHILKARRVEIFHGADRWVAVRMPLRVGEREQLKVSGAVWLVVVTGALLVLHHIALVIQIRLIECGEECAESVRLHPEDQLHPFGWHRSEVVGAIKPGRGIGTSSNRFNQREMLGL